MRTEAPFTLCCALLALGAVCMAECRARAHHQQASWQLARAAAYADGYVQTFDGTHVESQLAAFAERRAVLAWAERWEQGRALAALLMALLLVVAYGQWLHGRLEACRMDGPNARPAPPPSEARTLCRAEGHEAAQDVP